MITLVDAEKTFSKIQQLNDKNYQKKKKKNRKELHQIDKEHLRKTRIANVILNGKKIENFPLRSGRRQECPVTIPFQHCTLSPSQ